MAKAIKKPAVKKPKVEYSNPLSIPNVLKAYKELPAEESIKILDQYCSIIQAHGKQPKPSAQRNSQQQGIFAMRDEVQSILDAKEK
jgi:hypothetical protein